MIVGQNGFVWWFGVVEDTDDPLRLGRVRVRVFGYHAENKKTLPTSDLPWAHPLLDITSASISGVGKSPTGLVTGSHVFGFFRDGENAQQPVVMFSVGGIPEELAKKDLGFNDPTGTFPTKEYVDVKHSDVNFLATGKNTDQTLVQTKKDSVVSNVPVAWDTFETQRWSEPETPYDPKYPNNKVYSTQSGMVEEWDDTPGKERHHTYHPGGSFEEVSSAFQGNPPGTRVQKIKGNNYELIAGSDFVQINGSTKITINGECNVYIGSGLAGGSLNLQVDGNVNLQALKDVRSVVYGTWDVSVLGDYRENIMGNKYTKVFGNCVHEVYGLGGFVVNSFLGDVILKTKAGSDLALSGVVPSIKLNCLSRKGASLGDAFIIPGLYPNPFSGI
jgi:hypothetical protein